MEPNYYSAPLYSTENTYKDTGSIADVQSRHKTVFYPTESEVLSRYRRCQFAPGWAFQLILKVFVIL